MTLVIFINNLEYNLIEPENNLLTRLNKTEQTSSKNYTTK